MPETAVVDLSDSRSYVPGVPHEYLAHLRRHDPIHFQAEANGPGFWAVTTYDECVLVNRDFERFSSNLKGTMPFELTEDEVEQQKLMMLNMDPPLHTRYRRLVNKGFTPEWCATSRPPSTRRPTRSSTGSVAPAKPTS